MNTADPTLPAARKIDPVPAGLILFFIVFISYIAWFIAFAGRNKMDLVRDDYYDQEIKFQKQIDGLKRAASAGAAVSASFDAAARQVSVTLPPECAARHPEGAVILYRPSDAHLDSTRPLATDAAGTQRFDARGLPAGLWKIRVEWHIDGQDYFSEQPLVISGGS